MQKFTNLIISFLILIGGYFAYGILLSTIAQLLSVDLSVYKQDGILDLLQSDLSKAFVLIVVFGPIAEEMMFRALINPRHIDLMLFIVIWPVFFLMQFIPLDVHWAIKITFTAIFLFTVTYIVQQLIPKNRTIRVRNWLKQYEFLLLILTSLIFGFVHINNYVEAFTINLALVLLILPRIIAGFMLGYIKLKNESLFWSIFLHAMNNGLAFFFIVFFKGI